MTLRTTLSCVLLAAAIRLQAQTPAINRSNWGAVTAPVYGSVEPAFAAKAELFPGPNKFGSYYSGVLPNGKIVRPAGTSIQVGMNPLGLALTPSGKYLIVSNNNERSQNTASLLENGNAGGYSLHVVDTATMAITSRITTGRYFVGLQVTGEGPWTVWASAGPDNDIKLFDLSANGELKASTPASIPVRPVTPATEGYLSNYTPAPSMNAQDAAGNRVPVPVGFTRTGNTQITFPAGTALSPDGRYLYVACNIDNSVAVIDTRTKAVVRQLPAGYFPYGVAVSAGGDQVYVSNWGLMEYKFADAQYDSQGRLAALRPTEFHAPWGMFVPITSTIGDNPKTSSISVYSAPSANGASLSGIGAIYQGKPLDELEQVGDTHPSAMAVVRRDGVEVLYVTKSNSDALGRILVGENRRLPDFDLAPLPLPLPVKGSSPNALVVSPDGRRLYVAEAGLNSVAVLDTSDPVNPKLLGRIPTGAYPTALAISSDGNSLYIANAKGIGEDENPRAPKKDDGDEPATGLQSVSGLDSNFMFGSVQKVDLRTHELDNTTVLSLNFGYHPPDDTSIVPSGGEASKKIKRVFFILKENKTFDAMLGNMKDHFGTFASLTYHDRAGKPVVNRQYTGVTLNLQQYANAFATAVNYYSDAEESNIGHEFAASGIATDYSQKTKDVKALRGVVTNKNMDPEDYPEGGYIFNNAARNGVSFKVYGEMARIIGTDAGASTPTVMNDPQSGLMGGPQLQSDNFTATQPPKNAGDVTTPTRGFGQSYFVTAPGLAVLRGGNANGESRVDWDYPAWNFNISDQRRARRFIEDFDRMEAEGRVPQFLYIYQPNDHTGAAQAPNMRDVLSTVSGVSPIQQVADGDVALGMVVDRIMRSPLYYDPKTGEGAAIFITWDDAQSTLDHIHPHRTPMLVISPYAKPGYLGTRHYSTASIVKTEELLLGLPPNNLGDLFATDLRDMFQPTYNGITADKLKPRMNISYKPSPEGVKIWSLVDKLDLSAPDRDSERLGELGRLSVQADELRKDAEKRRKLGSRGYRKAQQRLYQEAVELVEEEEERER